MEKFKFDPSKDFEVYYETNHLGHLKMYLCESGIPILESDFSEHNYANMSVFDVMLLKLNQPFTKDSAEFLV